MGQSGTILGKPKPYKPMLRLAILFGIIALIAAIFGFTGIASAFASIAQVLFFIFLALCVILLIAGMVAGRKIAGR